MTRFSGYITETLKIMKISQLLMKKLMPFQMDTQLSQQDHLLETLAQEIVDITGKDQLYFYDAAAPIIEKNLLIWIKFT